MYCVVLLCSVSCTARIITHEVTHDPLYNTPSHTQPLQIHPPAQGTVKYEKPLATRVTVDDNRVSAQYETVDGSMIDCSLKGMVANVLVQMYSFTNLMGASSNLTHLHILYTSQRAWHW